MASRTAISSDLNPPCGLYVHLPFCETKCGYCDFFSVAVKGRDTRPLVERVLRELEQRVPQAPSPIATVFVGGGTPTILPAEQLSSLLERINRLVPRGGVREFTVEANPATVDCEKAALLVASGVTRVSMGAQSFVPAELEKLERLHSPNDIAPSVAVLREAGIGQVNLDLIFGVPGQTLASWAYSLERALALQPDHLACYGLTYEPKTRLTAQFQAGRITPCEENLEAELFEYTVETLAAAGFEQYETSNYARPGCRCLHNLIYWRNEPYVGVGPSAAGCYDGRRYKNIADVNGYIRLMDEQGHAEVESEVLDRVQTMIEMVMMQLRLIEGLSIEAFRQRTGMDPRAQFAEVLGRLSELGLIDVGDSHVALTRSGRLLGDAVIRELAGACELPQESTSD